MKYQVNTLNLIDQKIKINSVNSKTIEFTSYKKAISWLYDEILMTNHDDAVFLLVLENRGMKPGQQIVQVFQYLYEIENHLKGVFPIITLLKYRTFQEAFDEAFLIKMA